MSQTLIKLEQFEELDSLQKAELIEDCIFWMYEESADEEVRDELHEMWIQAQDLRKRFER